MYRYRLLLILLIPLFIYLLSLGITQATLTIDSTSLTSDADLTLKSASSSLISIGHPDQSGTITIASSTQALTLELGKSTSALTINIGAGTGGHTINIATGTSTAKTVNIATATGTQNTINIGSASSSVAISSTNWTISTAGTSTLSVPSGAIIFTDLASCPSGWAEVTSARGRYLVGLPSAGTLAAATGTALTNLENRPVGQHTHDISDPGHSHTVSLTTAYDYAGGA